MNRSLLLLLVLAASPALAGKNPLAVEGFGAQSRGGWQRGHDTVVVKRLDDRGRGSLRAALRTDGEPRVIRFGVEGDIELQSVLKVPSNVTIDGTGKRVRLVNQGISIRGSRHVVITHLTIADLRAVEGSSPPDGISITDGPDGPARHVVIDHVHLVQRQGEGTADRVDEAVSVINGGTDITVQWSRIENWEKAMLLGLGPKHSPEKDRDIRVTLHHNVFLRTARRHPRAHFGVFDVYNNAYLDWAAMYGIGKLFSDWAAAQNRAYGVLCHDECRLRLEANYFEKQVVESEDDVSWATEASRCEPAFFNATSHSAGSIVHVDNHVSKRSVPLQFGRGCASHDWRRPYPAKVGRADEALKSRLLREAGDPSFLR